MAPMRPPRTAVAGSAPRVVAVPASGRRRPGMTPMAVDLPAPLGPSRATVSPAAMSRLTPSSARTGPNALATWSKRTADGMGAAPFGHQRRPRRAGARSEGCRDLAVTNARGGGRAFPKGAGSYPRAAPPNRFEAAIMVTAAMHSWRPPPSATPPQVPATAHGGERVATATGHATPFAHRLQGRTRSLVHDDAPARLRPCPWPGGSRRGAEGAQR